MDDPSTPIFLSLGDTAHIVRVVVRLLVAAGIGAIMGFEREFEGKEAGSRTHMLVALGAALPMVFCRELGMSLGDISRVIQGIMTGIGFIGGGAILKLTQAHQIRGLTTASSIWVTAGAGLAIGLGALWPAVIATVFGMIILALLLPIEKRVRALHPPDADSPGNQAHPQR